VIRIGVLASGSGSNLQALLDATRDGRVDGKVAAVIGNVPGARALERAQEAGVPVDLLPSKGIADREAYDREIVARLQARQVDLVCLAGWMRLVTPAFLDAFGPTATTRGCPRVMNVHPALLPSFPGLHAPRQAIAAGVRLSGCTVHFVDAGTDTGPVIVQAPVPVLPTDDEAALAARILIEEHRIFPLAVKWFAEGRLEVRGRQVSLQDAAAPVLAGISNPSGDR
jgi:phosphoribosylglycinamide formyltransferase-1